MRNPRGYRLPPNGNNQLQRADAGPLGYHRTSGGDVPPEARGSELDGLLNFWSIFWRSKTLLAVAAVVGSLVGFAVTLPKPVMYVARAVIETQPAQNVAGLGPQQDDATATAIDASVRAQIEILRSGSLRTAVVQRLERELPPALPPVPPGILYTLRRHVLEKVLRRSPGSPVAAMRDALQECSRSLDARGMLGTRIITLTCEAPDPGFAATYLNTLVDEFGSRVVQNRRGSIEERTRWMAEQMEYLREKLEKSEQKLQSFLRGGNPIAVEPDFLKQTRLQQMEQTAASLEADRTAKQTLLASAQSASPEGFVLTPEGAALKPLMNRLQQARRDVADLSQKLTPKHERLQAAQQVVSELEEEFRGQRELILTRLRRDLEAAETREKMHRAAYGRQAQLSVAAAPADRVIEHNILQRQVELDRQLYQSFMTNIQQATLLVALPVNTARLIDPAQADLRPIQARTWTMNTLLGMFSALLLAVVWVLLREKTAQRVFSPEDVSLLLRLPELGVIPSTQAAPDDERWYGRWRRKLLRNTPRTNAVLDLAPVRPPNGERSEPVYAVDAQSFFAESFRGALASLTSLAWQGINPQVIVVTSPAPREGKSTVAANLALILGETSHRVLLIDADVRSPRLHQMLGMSNAKGLANVLEELRDIEQYELDELVRETSIPNVALMSSGAANGAAGRLFYSPRLAKLITRLRRDFEYIIIDTPPVLDFADARFVGRAADGMMVVLRSGSTDRSRAMTACQRILEDGLVLLGTILNDCHTSNGAYGSSGYRYYQARGAHAGERS